ncbi:XPG I-region [Ancylostoma ceylanicum]|uniref:XPG I-region n=1 Tax=Ancylostoma ceylanicum TaxID=53326 RepID=A0A0D6LI68_9BILA|nr:XPG I-region [Ancylostoma ceylanicum]
MGVPVVEAPCEAEAQCAALVKAKKVFAVVFDSIFSAAVYSVYGTATEDMDALTFGSDVLLRHMTFSEAKKMPIKEFSLSRILADFDMTKEQFIDLCILLGCDYCESIRGVGPKKAFELIKTYGDIETILENIDHKKYPPPENWPYKRARELFINPEVADCENINGRIDAFFSVNKTVKSEPTSAKRKAEEQKKATKKRGPPLKKPK